MSKKVYISAPIAGYDLQERKKYFAMMADRLRCCGYEPINPMENGVPDSENWRKHMKADMALLAGSDAIMLCENWYLSKGCKLEFDVATSCGMQIMSFEVFGGYLNTDNYEKDR